jgi:hypothetical protein
MKQQWHNRGGQRRHRRQKHFAGFEERATSIRGQQNQATRRNRQKQIKQIGERETSRQDQKCESQRGDCDTRT